MSLKPTPEFEKLVLTARCKAIHAAVTCLAYQRCYPPSRGTTLRITRPAPRDADDAVFDKSLEVSGLVALAEHCWPTPRAQDQ